MAARTRIARWIRRAGWAALPLIFVPLGALAMYVAVEQRFVPGASIPACRPEVIVRKASELLDDIGKTLPNIANLDHFRTALAGYFTRKGSPTPVSKSGPFLPLGEQPVLTPLSSTQTAAVSPSSLAADQTNPEPSAPKTQARPTQPARAQKPEPRTTDKASEPSVLAASLTADQANPESPVQKTQVKPAQPARAQKPEPRTTDKVSEPRVLAANLSSEQANPESPVHKTQAKPVQPARAQKPEPRTTDKASEPRVLASSLTSDQASPELPVVAPISHASEPQEDERPTTPATPTDPPKFRIERRYPVGPVQSAPVLEARPSPEVQTAVSKGASLAANATQTVSRSLLAIGTAQAATASQAANATQDVVKNATSSEQERASGFPANFSPGSLGQMAQLRAELEQLRLQVHIEEVRVRLNQLRGQGAPPPSLEFPPIGLPAKSSATPAETGSALRILSIQSLNGKYTATVGTASGPRVVSVNDNVSGCRVVSITRNSVVINRGQGNEMLSIYE